MAFAAPALSQAQMIRNSLFSIKGVERVFINNDRSRYGVLIVLPEMNRDIERQVFAREQEIITAFPDSDFDFDIVFLCGRELRDIISPKGKEVFASR